MSDEEVSLPRCKQCGDTVPQGKELCWVCEHTPKLHKPEQQKCADSCDIQFPEKGSESKRE